MPSSIEYAEKHGLEIALSNLKIIKDPTKETSIVIKWIELRLQELKNSV